MSDDFLMFRWVVWVAIASASWWCTYVATQVFFRLYWRDVEVLAHRLEGWKRARRSLLAKAGAGVVLVLGFTSVVGSALGAPSGIVDAAVLGEVAALSYVAGRFHASVLDLYRSAPPWLWFGAVERLLRHWQRRRRGGQ